MWLLRMVSAVRVIHNTNRKIGILMLPWQHWFCLYFCTTILVSFDQSMSWSNTQAFVTPSDGNLVMCRNMHTKIIIIIIIFDLLLMISLVPWNKCVFMKFRVFTIDDKYCITFFIVSHLMLLAIHYYTMSSFHILIEQNINSQESHVLSVIWCVSEEPVQCTWCTWFTRVLSFGTFEWTPSIFPYCAQGNKRLLSFSDVQFSAVIVPVAHCLRGSQ